jgi:hypothetical protein
MRQDAGGNTMIRMKPKPTPIVMEEVTDPEELARARLQDERFKLNLKWYEAHAVEIGNRYRGKCYCVCGQELFVGDDPREVFERAKAAHPEDDGRFTGYVPKERMYRIYAHRGVLARMRRRDDATGARRRGSGS